MTILTSNEQVRSLIRKGVLAVDGDLVIDYSDCTVKAHISCQSLLSTVAKANLNCFNINCSKISSLNNIHADNIMCNGPIQCNQLNYSMCCCAEREMVISSIKGRHINSKHFTLNGDIKIVCTECGHPLMEI